MNYDLCIIGAGWAGFNAALKAARLGKKVCIVDDKEIGGTCLNRGCIPTKAFVYHSKTGLKLPEILKKRDEVVLRLRDGMLYLVKSNKVDYFKARALIKKDGSVFIGDGNTIKPKFILIATGSVAKELPNLKIDHNKVISSDDALALTEIPDKLLIVGAGAIGCEFASIFKRLGSSVAITDIASQLLPGIDNQVAKKLQTAFQKSGISVSLNNSNDLNIGDYDKVLLSVGRAPVSSGIWEDGVDINLERGAISADFELRTSRRGVFAAGDCISGYMLAHVAAYEGELAVNNMFSRPIKRDYTVTPSSVFCSPEISSIGLSEAEAKNFGADFKAVVVHFLSVGMAHIHDDTQGFVKVIFEKRSGRILGASIIGLEASELINSFSILMRNKITASGMRNTIFAHPSISEILGEVARSFEQ